MTTLELKNDIIRFIASTNDDHILSQIRDLIFSIEEEEEGDTEEQILANIKQGFLEMELIKRGKMKSRPAKEFLDEL